MLFTVPEWAQVRQGKKSAHLVPRLEKYAPRRLTPVRRLIIVHDADGNAIGSRREYVEEGEGERLRVVLTIIAVEQVDVLGEWPAPALRSLTTQDATASGFRTVGSLRSDWNGKYPRSAVAQLVWFVVGDQRDRDIFLNRTGTSGGDYTPDPRKSIDPDAPALTPEQLEQMTQRARSAEHDATRYQMLRARDGLMKSLREMQYLAATDGDLSQTLRRLERELAILDRKISSRAPTGV